MSQAGSSLAASLRPLRALLQCAPRLVEPTGSPGPFQPPQLYRPGLVCIPTAAGPCIYPSAYARAAGTGPSDPHHTPLSEFLQLSEARTWAWNSGSSGTPQSLCPGPAPPGSGGACSDPAHFCGVSAGAKQAS